MALAPDSVAAISCGVYNDVPVLDLEYEEDSNAMVDANFVITGKGAIVEVQGTGESRPFSDEELQQLILLAKKGIVDITLLQRKALGRAIASQGRGMSLHRGHRHSTASMVSSKI